ncbi:receptor-like protein EIX1 [Bidens hawaiensis]|uniref:receptor-like protein EIX1 n=1 Tax=Bidens hawaiensis TaxID=980011 RepID=UPI00404A81DC
MGNHRVLGLHLVFLSMFLVATEYTCLGAQNSTRSFHEQERQALLEFKHSINDECGVLSSWVGTNCCSWKGVRCDGATGNVVGLHLRGNRGNAMEEYYYYYYYYIEQEEECYLEGDKVNAYLGELRHLKHLDLSGNYFQGSQIPEFIGSFKQLSYLNLSYAGFSGIIPHHIGNLSNLKVLDLGSRYDLPQGLIANDVSWVSSLSSLDHLDLSYVNLSHAKNIDMVFHIIPSLTYLSLKYCELSDVNLGLHLNSSKILPNIQHLDLGFNHFEGQLPHFLQNMTSLTFLDLSSYYFSLARNSLKLLNMFPSLSELHLSECGLNNAHFSPTYLNFSALPNIQYLDLSENSIGGKFPSELMNITSLRVLSLSFNCLNSSIPVMPNLLKLDVSYNNLWCIELVGIWRQCHLKELSLSVDYFGKEMIIPSSNTSECSQYALEMLLSNINNFNGSIPESIGKLNNLRVLRLGGYSLIGSIPESLGRLTNLRVLELWGNNLTFSVQESLGRLTNLRISENSLTGSIPESLASLTNLRELQISENSLTGSIPESLASLTNLRVLELTSNSLTGSIPESFGRLKGLTWLSLQSNRLTGPVPASLGTLDSLEYLDLSANLLTSLPVSIGQLSKLVDLDLSDNSLEGVVSDAHFTNLSTLENLNTSSNYKLIFNFSREWIPPFQLRTVNLKSCNITNGFPWWLQTQNRLERLVLSNASIHGLLPTGLWKMSMLDELNLSHNNLGGSLTNLRFSEYTGYLLLHDNFFNGSLPRSLCQSARLRHLDVSSNRLSGNIPDCVENLQNLTMLILSSNGLSGVLPSSLGNIVSLEWLKLNDNNFSGELPLSFGSLRSLIVLDLGDNEFSGSIPLWIGENLTHLKILRLHKNSFTGGIPQSLCKFPHLHILDIAHNNITGSIPHCFGELSGMIDDGQQDFQEGMYSDDRIMVQYINVMQVMKGTNLEYTKTMRLVVNMDLSSNKLTGEIPPEVTALVLLMGLNLSHNHLSGSIPDSIGKMKALNSLDFSDNHLTGTIPPSMADLNFLSFMNLSHNNLSGRIPTGNQLQTLTDPSIYAGNRDLCGAPLPNNCSNHEKPPTITSNKKPNNVWFYLDITCGFATGFWGVIGVLSFKKQWRQKLFMIAEEAMDKVFMMVAVRVSKIKRGREVK